MRSLVRVGPGVGHLADAAQGATDRFDVEKMGFGLVGEDESGSHMR